MKSLDEMIKALERCGKIGGCKGCKYARTQYECSAMYNFGQDALQYLKAYKDDKDELTALRAFWKEQHENDALTWDELRKLEGKPVWVEILSDEIDLSSRWMMVARETKAHSLPLAYTDDMGHWIYGHEDDLGKAWQAYRKERG